MQHTAYPCTHAHTDQKPIGTTFTMQQENFSKAKEIDNGEKNTENGEKNVHNEVFVDFYHNILFKIHF